MNTTFCVEDHPQAHSPRTHARTHTVRPTGEPLLHTRLKFTTVQMRAKMQGMTHLSRLV